MATENELQAETITDSFADAFARLSGLEEGQTEPPKDPVAAPAPTPAVEDAPPETAGADAPTEKPAESEESADEAEPQEESLNDEILERLARLVKEAPPATQPETVAAAPQPQEAPAIYSNEEMQIISNYEKEWPDVAKAEALRRKAEYRELVEYVFGEVAKELRPIVETVHTMTQRTHLSDLKSTVTDYDDVRDKVVSWAEQQPAYLQLAYKHVIENGTVDEVADLIDRYKRETGATARPAAAPATRKVETELPSATKQAAAALAPVSSKRSAVLQATDPDDFESAFASFAGKM